LIEFEKLKQEVLTFLVGKSGREYTAMQIAAHLGLKKDFRIEVQAVLNELFRQRKVDKNGKRYFVLEVVLSNDVKTGSILSQHKAAPSDLDSHSSDDVKTGSILSHSSTTRVGKFDATSLVKNMSFAFVIMEDSADIYISAEDTLNAYHGDIVEVELSKNRFDKPYGIITKIVTRNKDKFIGVISEINHRYYFRSDNRKIHTTFDVNPDDTKHNDYTGKKVMVEIVNWGIRQKNKTPICKVIEVLGVSGEPEVELLSVIREFDLPLEFPDAVIDEANAHAENFVISTKGRSDFRSLFTITIDPISAKDFDDAISLFQMDNGDMHLYVHIADVSEFVKIDSPLYNEAMQRGNSYYFPKKVIPMLPEVISNGLCSLRPDEDKYAMTVLTVFDKKGVIKSQEAMESIIRSNHRLAYEEVDEYIDGTARNVIHATPELATTINNMRKLSDKLSKERYGRGYLKFNMPEIEFDYDDEGRIENMHRSVETESHVMIENFMLLANEYVATILTKKYPHTMYRIHEEPDERDLTKIRELLRAYKISFQIDQNPNRTWQNILEALPDERFQRVFDRMVLRSMKKAKYSIKHEVHFGLGLHTYTHFTSPIRRLCDLIVHTQLKSLLRKKILTDLGETELFKLAGISSDREVIADEAERMMTSKVLTTFMQTKVGNTYSAIVINLNSNTIFIELDDIPVRGVIKLSQLNDDYYEFNEKTFTIKGKRRGRIFRLCDQLTVQLVNVTDEIFFDVVGERKSQNTEKKLKIAEKKASSKKYDRGKSSRKKKNR
jgi:ribonuclease R